MDLWSLNKLYYGGKLKNCSFDVFGTVKINLHCNWNGFRTSEEIYW